ncbi:MAG TPA: hypothetical protein VN181_09200 [Thermoanaerobaculia bacterium]|nr:hypothetical protein [Thermoanaerobaculia bacterium]
MTVRLHIDRLVLDGIALAHRDRAIFVAAIEAELGQLVAARGIAPALTNGVALPSVAAPDVTLAPGAKPSQMGTAVAASIYRGVGR